MPALCSDENPALVAAHEDEIRSLKLVPESGYPGYDEYVAPARFWGERLDIADIYRTYEDILGDRHAEIQDELFDIHKRTISEEERESKVLDLYRKLVSAHPDLPHEIVQTTSHVSTVVYGCVSQFCPEDIRFYIADKRVRQSEAWQNRKAEVEVIAGGWHLEWCASLPTLHAIERAVVNRALHPYTRIVPAGAAAAPSAVPLF